VFNLASSIQISPLRLSSPKPKKYVAMSFVIIDVDSIKAILLIKRFLMSPATDNWNIPRGKSSASVPPLTSQVPPYQLVLPSSVLSLDQYATSLVGGSRVHSERVETDTNAISTAIIWVAVVLREVVTHSRTVRAREALKANEPGALRIVIGHADTREVGDIWLSRVTDTHITLSARFGVDDKPTALLVCVDGLVLSRAQRR